MLLIVYICFSILLPVHFLTTLAKNERKGSFGWNGFALFCWVFWGFFVWFYFGFFSFWQILKVLMTANDFQLQSSIIDFNYQPNSSGSDYILPPRMPSYTCSSYFSSSTKHFMLSLYCWMAAVFHPQLVFQWYTIWPKRLLWNHSVLSYTTIQLTCVDWITVRSLM